MTPYFMTPYFTSAVALRRGGVFPVRKEKQDSRGGAEGAEKEIETERLTGCCVVVG